MLVTETPPGSPNGFGVTLDCMFRKTPHDVIFTDAEFKDYAQKKGFHLAQVPFHRGRRHWLFFFLGLIPEWNDNYSSKWLSRNLSEKYSLVYSFVYSASCMKFANWISNSLKIPLFVHLADHSPDFESSNIRNISQTCKKLICITEEMKQKYESMIGRKDIEVIHNGAEDRCFKISEPSFFGKKKPFILCFLGGLFSHLHGDCIEDVISAVQIIRTKYPWFEFHLYGQVRPDDFLNEELKLPGIVHHGVIMPLDKKYEIMENAHCFLLPSTFKVENHAHYKYSFPTKLTELIASGRPIVFVGPKDTASNHFLAKYDLGLRIHQRSVENISSSILQLIENYPQWNDRSSVAKKKMENYFSGDAVRTKVSRLINSI